jgi:hypothetical protein
LLVLCSGVHFAPPHTRCWQIGVLGLVALWLLTLATASSERLHHLLHDDAHQVAHECVFTHLANGQVHTAPELSAPRPTLPVFSSPDHPGLVLLPAPAILWWQPPRGPPAPLSVAS